MSRKKKSLNRRQFIQFSTAAGGAALLAACGGSAAPESAPAPAAEPTAVPPTPVPPEPTAAPAAADPDVTVMVKDVLDYQLDSADWPGDFGSVTFRLHEGRVNGEPIYYIRTDCSDATFAEQEGLVYVPLLNTANGQDIANKLYIFDDGSPAVMQYSPNDPEFASLCQINNISGGGADLDSMEAVEAAVESGAVTIEETFIFVNFPIIKWSGGTLAVDDAFEAALGNGQLFSEPDMDNMTVTMKLHQCYPGSRYIVTDTSMPGMAPMMSINAAEPTQKLMDVGGTDEIWVFANGIPGSGVMGFQPAIFDNKAGEPAWSPFWNHFTLRWVDESNARVIKSSVEVRELIESGELEEFNGVPDTHPNGFVVNCPAPILAPNDFEG